MSEEKSYAWIWVLLVMIVLSMPITGYLLLNREQPRICPGPVRKLTLAAYASDTGSLTYMAKDKGYFKDNGLEVTIKAYEAGKLAADALLFGEADISASAGFDFVGNRFHGHDWRILRTISPVNINELVSRKDHGIQGAEDLREEMVGVTRKSTGEFFGGTFLIFNEEIDAAVTWDPNTYNIKNNLGESIVSWPWQSDQDFNLIIIAREDWLKANVQAVERFMNTLIQAERL